MNLLKIFKPKTDKEKLILLLEWALSHNHEFRGFIDLINFKKLNQYLLRNGYKAHPIKCDHWGYFYLKDRDFELFQKIYDELREHK